MAGASRHQQGFTLLEILLVIAIMAMTAMMVAPSYFSALSDGIDDEADRLVQTLRLAHDEAELTSTPMRLLLSADAYSFESADAYGAWKPISKSPFESHKLGEDLIILETRPLLPMPELDARASDNDKKQTEPLLAVLPISPDGSLPVVDIALQASDGRERVIAVRSGPGGIAMVKPE